MRTRVIFILAAAALAGGATAALPAAIPAADVRKDLLFTLLCLPTSKHNMDRPSPAPPASLRLGASRQLDAEPVPFSPLCNTAAKRKELGRLIVYWISPLRRTENCRKVL